MGNFELPEDVTVVKAANLSQIYDSNFVQHRAFGTSLEDLNHTVNSNVLGNNQVRIYNLIYDGQPSSTVTVVSGQISEMPVVQVWSMATLPELQGKGLGKNLLQKVLNESLRVGFNCAALLATDEGKHLYDRLGFQSISQNPRFQIGKKDD